MSDLITYTRYKSTNALSKTYGLVDGNLTKQSAAQMAAGTASRITSTFQQFATALDTASSSDAVGFGIFDSKLPDEVEIRVKSKANGINAISRSKEYFSYSKSAGVMMIDHDPSPYGKTFTSVDLVAALTAIDPNIGKAAMLERGSVSAGVHKLTEEPATAAGFHIYLPVIDASLIPAYGKLLTQHLWLNGHGYIALAANGALLTRTCIDAAVFSPERFDFVGKPILKGRGLVYTKPASFITEGNLLDLSKLPKLTPTQEMKVDALITAAKASISDKSEQKHSEWLAGKVDHLTGDKQLLINQLSNLIKSDTKDLYGSYLLHFANGDNVTVAEVLANVDRYDGLPLADPIEGSAYGSTTACFYANAATGKPVVNSLAHGANWRYFLHIEEASELEIVLPNTGKPFSLHSFSISGDTEKMTNQLLDEHFVLEGIALRGQMTVLYAKPNTGKTLITLWLLIQSIKNETVNPKHIYYVNADDDLRGLITKAKLAEEYGFEMLSPGYKGFTASHMKLYLKELVKADTARDTVIVLDTLKKFTSLMDKKLGSEFMAVAGEFISAGGTIIALAHTNKNRDGEGKVIFSGTSDVSDDASCAYTIDELEQNNGIKRVLFENFKSRGSNEQTVAFNYSVAKEHDYLSRLDSVRREDEYSSKLAQEIKLVGINQEKDELAIVAISEAITSGVILKTELIDYAAKESGLSKPKILKVLTRYQGLGLSKNDLWAIKTGIKNSKTFSLI